MSVESVELPILCGIILHPAGHTLSPILHTTAYNELGLDARYHAFDVPQDALPDAVAGMRALGIRQLSVSLPHKEAVLELADRVSEHARRIGAANTLTRFGDEIVADNTDWVGVRRTLEPLGDWRGKRVTVVGAGGESRTARGGPRRARGHARRSLGPAGKRDAAGDASERGRAPGPAGAAAERCPRL